MPLQLSIVIPTYNEVDNISALLQGIRNVLDNSWKYETIIVDDNSPDGTSDVVRSLAAQDGRITLLQRPKKSGLGSALLEGFQIARGKFWLMIDADLSHRPQDIPRLLEHLPNTDVVIGSRYIVGGSTENWPLNRRIASRFACLVGRTITGIRIRDLTSGFAGFQSQFLGPLLPKLHPKGFKLLMEILAKSPHAKVKEVPIVFVERSSGQSKMTLSEISGYVKSCFSLRFGWS